MNYKSSTQFGSFPQLYMDKQCTLNRRFGVKAKHDCAMITDYLDLT